MSRRRARRLAALVVVVLAASAAPATADWSPWHRVHLAAGQGGYTSPKLADARWDIRVRLYRHGHRVREVPTCCWHGHGTTGILLVGWRRFHVAYTATRPLVLTWRWRLAGGR